MWGIGYNAETDVLPDFPDVLSEFDVLKPEPASREPDETDLAPFSPPVLLLGVPFVHARLEEELAAIDRMIASRQPHCIITANVDFLVQSMQDEELHRIMLEADQVICDGTPLLWASRLLGNALPERVAGADLVPLLLARSAEKGYRIFFLGGESEIAERAVENVRARYPGAVICGHYSPPFKPLLEMDHADIVSRIQAARPDILFVSFGCPKAEKWISMHFRKLGVPVSIGVGGTIDFLAGKLKRAPQWMQRAGLEWCYRLKQEPRRLCKRYGGDLWHFAKGLSSQYFCLRPKSDKKRAPGESAVVMLEPTWKRIMPPPVFDRASLEKDEALWKSCSRNHFLLDLGHVQAIDSTAVGLLGHLHKKLQQRGFFLLLLKPSPAVTRALRLMRLSRYFLVAEDVHAAQELIRKRTEEAELRYHPDSFHHTFPLLWRGEITACNAEKVWLQIENELVAAAGVEDRIPIDLSEVRFIDSTGVGLLARTRKHAEHLGVSVRFTGVPAPIRNVLRLSK